MNVNNYIELKNLNSFNFLEKKSFAYYLVTSTASLEEIKSKYSFLISSEVGMAGEVLQYSVSN